MEELTWEEVQKVLNTPKEKKKKKEQEFRSSFDSYKKEIREAIVNRKKTVLLGNRVFKVKYRKGRAFIYPADHGHTPCGEFEL